MKGKWAKGIAPRFFAWIIKDKLAVSERPGGYARNHRPVRRQEEILWLRGEGFTRVVSLLMSPHNLHAYDKLDLPWAHIPFGPHDDPHLVLPDLYGQLRDWMAADERLLLHQEELGDRLMGVVAGYLRWSGLVPAGPQAISVVERILHRQMGPEGRMLVAIAPDLAGAHCSGAPRPAGGRDLVAADLRGADLTAADLTGADLSAAAPTTRTARPRDSRPAILRPAVRRSAERRAAPAAPGPADLGPADSTPADSNPADSNPADPAPAPADPAPADLTPPPDPGSGEVAPADAGPTDLTPADLGTSDREPANLGPPNLAPRNGIATEPASRQPDAPHQSGATNRT